MKEYLFEINLKGGIENFCFVSDEEMMNQFGVNTSSWVKIECDNFDEKRKYKIQDNKLIEINEQEYSIYFEQEELEKTKKLKLAQLEADFNASKKIILQNGNTLAIKHDTPERKFFTDNLENLKRIEEAENSVLSYRQRVGNIFLGFSALSYIWKHLFLEKFTEQRPSLTLETKRSKNKETYDLKKLKIEIANSIEELEAIDWSFEDITVININVEAQKLIDDPKTPAYVIDAINQLKGEDGQIHLIKEL